MKREIKFRSWSKAYKSFMGQPDDSLIGINHSDGDLFGIVDGKYHSLNKDNYILMQYTGLKDRNGLQDLYEGDIVDIEGSITGNIYENDKREADLVIQGFGTKDWIATYKEAVDRGCKDAE